MKPWILTATLLAGGLFIGACDPQDLPPTPAIAGTWIDAPESGATILLAPYTIVFHSASVMGMDEFELSIDGQLLASVPPKTTGPGGQQGTLFMADYEWYPPEPGVYQIEVRAKDQNALYGAAAQAQVTVLEAVTDLEPAPELQPEIEQLSTGLPTLQLAPTPTSTLIPQGLGQPQYSAEVIYFRGTGCGPKQVDIQIQVNDPAAFSVVLFGRLEETNSGEKTAWTPIPMVPMGDGYYGLTLTVESTFPEVRNYETSALQVQIVATDPKGDEVGRTPVDSQVSVERCSR